MSKKLTTREFKRLKTLTGEHTSILSKIGAVELQKKGLLDEIDELMKEFNKFMKELKEVYGDVQVNLETGDILETPKEETDLE